MQFLHCQIGLSLFVLGLDTSDNGACTATKIDLVNGVELAKGETLVEIDKNTNSDFVVEIR